MCSVGETPIDLFSFFNRPITQRATKHLLLASSSSLPPPAAQRTSFQEEEQLFPKGCLQWRIKTVWSPLIPILPNYPTHTHTHIHVGFLFISEVGSKLISVGEPTLSVETRVSPKKLQAFSRNTPQCASTRTREFTISFRDGPGPTQSLQSRLANKPG